MSAIQVTINGVPDQVVKAYMTSLPILSSGLDENANTTLNNVQVQNYPDGGNIKIGELAMNSAVNNPLTNIAIGYNALPVVDGIASDSDNIAIGQNSLSTVTTGGKNIGIGLNSLSGLTTQTNTIGIGNNTLATVSNGIIIGNNAELTANNSGILKFDAITTNTTYPASNEFWFGDSTTGWIDVKAGDVYVDNLDVSGSLTTGSLSLDSLQVTSDTGELDIKVRDSTYNNLLNKIDEIRNTASLRNKYGPIAFIADVSGVLSSQTDPILREKILFGYQQGTKAVEINAYGAISLDSFNSGNPLPALTSNYGTTGQILSSQGSALNAKWSSITDISGVIGLNNRNIGGITYVKDSSGNLDSSSNFIYDGSGVNVVANKNSQLYGMQIRNTSTGGTASSDLTLKNSTNTATFELKSTGYTPGTTIDANTNMLSISNPTNSININPGDRTLIGYSSNNKAIEIASTGAMSFDTSNNYGSWVSNYGISGQILSSQGSSLPPQWKTVTDISGIITTYNKNVNGITYIRDLSGNLDSSSNFIYDGSGVNVVANKNSPLYGLQIQNMNTSGSASSDLTLKNSANTATFELKSTGYTAGTTMDANTNMLSISNPTNSININPGDRTLIGYSSNTKAIEIASTGAMSFDTSNNSGTFVSNYGISGQILSSQGSGAPPKWIENTGGGCGIIVQNPYINGVPYVIDLSGNLDSTSDFIWDGSGVKLSASNNNAISLLTLQNTKGTTTSQTILQLQNNQTPTIGNTSFYTFNSDVYGNSTNLIDQGGNTLSLKNTHGRIALIPDSSNTTPSIYQKILLGYKSGAKAIEINSSGAMSFDTSGNNDSAPMTFTSNYGISGEQIMISRGSNAPPRWGSIIDLSGGITTFNRNINGITYVRDLSGNLDSSSNFIYDGSGIYIKSQKFGDYYGMTIENTTVAGNSTTTQLKFIGFNNSGLIDLKGSLFQQYTNKIDQTINNFSFKSPNGDISLMAGYNAINGGKILLGYNSGYKAIEINRYGAMSFDTSGNNDTNLTFTSNYGSSGQVLTSQGSSAPPQWSNISYARFPKIIYITSEQYSPIIYDTSGTLFSYNDASGLTQNKTRVISFTTSLKVGLVGITNLITYSLHINGSGIATQSFNQYMPLNKSAIQHTIVFIYSNTNIAETIQIKFNAGDNTIDFGSSDLRIFRMEEIQ